MKMRKMEHDGCSGCIYFFMNDSDDPCARCKGTKEYSSESYHNAPDMYTPDSITDTLREEFIILWRTYVNPWHEGAEELLEWIKTTDFFTAPASVKYHLNRKSGLLEHTLNVAHEAEELLHLSHFKDCNKYEVITAALLHDLCKIGLYREIDDGKYTYTNRLTFGHGEESVMMAREYMTLTDAEIFAIRWHMGAYTGEKDWNNLTVAYKTHPESMLLHFADMLASKYDED